MVTNKPSDNRTWRINAANTKKPLHGLAIYFPKIQLNIILPFFSIFQVAVSQEVKISKVPVLN